MLDFLGDGATMKDVEDMLNDADLDNDGQSKLLPRECMTSSSNESLTEIYHSF
jgi:hypothetical protein